jgi:hypothetical protein
MRWLFVVVGLLGACGSESTTPADLAMTPADLAVAGCPLDGLRGYFVSTLAFLPDGEGFDLDGNGTIDNRLGPIGSLANSQLTQSVTAGNTTLLFGIAGLAGPPLVEGDRPEVSTFVGIDADMPIDPSNNASDGAFLISSEQFDVNCKSTAVFGESLVKNGVIESKSTESQVSVGSVGTIRFVNSRNRLTPLDAQLDTWDGVIGGIELACSLSITPYPGPNPASLLDVVVNYGLQPDMDRDGDGLEQINGDGTTVKECIDGDGTVIPGRNCPCDPRIADGFSEDLRFHLVPARLVGVLNAQ